MTTIRLSCETGFAGCTHKSSFEVPDADWAAMTEEEKEKFLDELAQDFQSNHIGTSAWVEGDGK